MHSYYVLARDLTQRATIPTSMRRFVPSSAIRRGGGKLRTENSLMPGVRAAEVVSAICITVRRGRRTCKHQQ